MLIKLLLKKYQNISNTNHLYLIKKNYLQYKYIKYTLYNKKNE